MHKQRLNDLQSKLHAIGQRNYSKSPQAKSNLSYRVENPNKLSSQRRQSASTNISTNVTGFSATNVTGFIGTMKETSLTQKKRHLMQSQKRRHSIPVQMPNALRSMKRPTKSPASTDIASLNQHIASSSKLQPLPPPPVKVHDGEDDISKVYSTMNVVMQRFAKHIEQHSQEIETLKNEIGALRTILQTVKNELEGIQTQRTSQKCEQNILEDLIPPLILQSPPTTVQTVDCETQNQIA